MQQTLRAAIEDLFNERTELSIYFYRLKLLNNWMIYLGIYSNLVGTIKF